MPAGVTWSKYLKFLTASLLSMFAGASVVHNYYKPNLIIVGQHHNCVEYSHASVKAIPDNLPDPKEQDTQQRKGIQKIISIKKD